MGDKRRERKRHRRDNAALEEVGQVVARDVVRVVVQRFGGTVPLLQVLGATYTTGIEIGIALAKGHPGLADRLLEAADAVVHEPRGITAADHRARHLTDIVEAMDR